MLIKELWLDELLTIFYVMGGLSIIDEKGLGLWHMTLAGGAVSLDEEWIPGWWVHGGGVLLTIVLNVGILGRMGELETVRL